MCKFTLTTQFLYDLDSNLDFGWYDFIAETVARGIPLAILDMVNELGEAYITAEVK